MNDSFYQWRANKYPYLPLFISRNYGLSILLNELSADGGRVENGRGTYLRNSCEIMGCITGMSKCFINSDMREE